MLTPTLDWTEFWVKQLEQFTSGYLGTWYCQRRTELLDPKHKSQIKLKVWVNIIFAKITTLLLSPSAPPLSIYSLANKKNQLLGPH